MTRFSRIDAVLGGVIVIERQEISDDRGSFGRLFCQNDLKSFGWNKPVAQVNVSRTRAAGSVRGLHYQLPPHAEIKYVVCNIGKIFDVAVDLRRNSSTFLQWRGFELSAENNKQLLIPKGFAHGFSVLSETAEVMYKCDEFYYKESEAGIFYNDAALNIDWNISAEKAIISDKDQQQPSLLNCKNNFEFEQ